MPAKGKTTRPQHEIDKWVRKHLEDGVPVRDLAKLAKVSVPGFYLWVSKAKAEMYEKSKRLGMSPVDIEKSDKQNMLYELDQVKMENTRLRERLMAVLIKHGEL